MKRFKSAPVRSIRLLAASIAVGFALSSCSAAPDFHSAVLSQLRDPQSAQFQRETVRSIHDGKRVMCGEVNARNAFGGYAGFRRFVSMLPGNAVLEPGFDASYASQALSHGFDGLWAEFCLNP